jgi:DNA polymerase I-like protein with 3'-5' exonuclease and polymerase domains
MAKKKGWKLSPFDSPELVQELKKYKSLDAGEYKKFKCIVLGLGYGEGRNTLFANNPGTFDSVKEAGELKEFVFETFPKIRQWQQQVVQMARKEGMIKNPYGYIRWFFDCPGSDTTKVLAQLPQSTGAAMVRDDMWEISITWLGEYLILQVHDELMFEVPDECLPDAVELIRSIMSRKRPELGGHSIAVEIKYGKNWAEMIPYAL